MDSGLVREYVHRKKKTVWGTFFLLIILALEFYYLNCFMVYVLGFCELTFLFIILAIIVANIGIFYGGEGKKIEKPESSLK
jgi:hypothetical protein